MLIEGTTPKSTSDNYSNLLGDKKLGYSISQVQSAAIKNGYDLEGKVLLHTIKANGIHINDDNILEALASTSNQIYIMTGKEGKKISILNSPSSEPDLIIIKNGHIWIIELKYGSKFDTKKSLGEMAALRDNVSFFQKHYIKHKIKGAICLFSCPSKEKIMEGLKNYATLNEIITASELCELLNIHSPTDIIDEFKKDGPKNFRYLFKTLLNTDNEDYKHIVDEEITRHLI